MRSVDGFRPVCLVAVFGAHLAEQVRDGAVAVDYAAAAVGGQQPAHGLRARLLVAEGEALGELPEQVPGGVGVVAVEKFVDGVVDVLDGVAVVQVRGGVGVQQQVPVRQGGRVQPGHPLEVDVLQALHVGALAAVEQPGGLEGGGAGAGVHGGVAEPLRAESSSS